MPTRPVAKGKVKKQNAKSDKISTPKKARRVEAILVDDEKNEDSNETLGLESAPGEAGADEIALIDPEDVLEDLKSSKLPVPSALEANSSKGLTVTDPVALYLREIRKYRLLTKEEEVALAKKYYETKDPEAAQALVTSNLRFVVKVAADYSKFGARLIDLIQEGNMGLMHAVREFNPYKGVRLITYAVWWIRGYIQEYLMKQYSLVKIGTTQNQKKLFYRLQKEKEALDALGESPDFALIGTRLGIPKEEVEEMNQRIRGRDVSLSQPLDGEGSSSLMDFQRSSDIGPDDQLAAEEEIQLLRRKIELLKPSLNEREKILLEERLLADDPLTLQEIGEKYGITREAVRQAETRLMKKIRDLVAPEVKSD